MNQYRMDVIAYIQSDFSTKFGIPRQSGMVEELKAEIIFEPSYRNLDAIRGLEGFSYIWIIWEFSEAVRKNWSATVRPPRLGGNTRMGVFATRSPFRPNPIGLSSVRLDKIEIHPQLGPILHILGADLMNHTPILDIKPYLPQVDSHPEAKSGFTGQVRNYELEVECQEEWLSLIPQQKRKALLGVLAQDPRPSYQNNPERIYGMEFSGYEVKFTVEQKKLYVCEIKRIEEDKKE